MYTHHIIRMERGETSGSRSPMWRCVCADGTKVNVFSHSRPERDSYRLFAAFADCMDAMEPGDRLSWTQTPIPVHLEKDGEWWRVLAVAAREPAMQPDPVITRDLTLNRSKAIRQARILTAMNTAPRIYLDTETTSIDPATAEPISIAVLASNGLPLFESLIRPVDDRLLQYSVQVHGITPQSAALAPAFLEVAHRIHDALTGTIWIGYNVAFDATVIERAFLRHGLVPPAPLALVDAMPLYAEFAGTWDEGRDSFGFVKLGEACAALDIPLAEAHNATQDARAVYDLLRAIAQEAS